jgi:zinc transport system substrate-binding protein
VLIDPTAKDDAFRLIDLPMRRVHFAVDSVRPKFAYVFTEDGKLASTRCSHAARSAIR